MSEQFYDLKFERLEDGAVHLVQRDSAGNDYGICAHPVQLIHIARTLTRAKVTPEAERIKTLERRLRWLQDRFSQAYGALPHDFWERCADAEGFITWLHASCDVAEEYCADLTPPETTPPASVPLLSHGTAAGHDADKTRTGGAD